VKRVVARAKCEGSADIQRIPTIRSTPETYRLVTRKSLCDPRELPPLNRHLLTILRNDGTTERRKSGTTGSEETQTAADKTGTAAEPTEDQKLPTLREILILLKKTLGTPLLASRAVVISE